MPLSQRGNGGGSFNDAAGITAHRWPSRQRTLHRNRARVRDSKEGPARASRSARKGHAPPSHVHREDAGKNASPSQAFCSAWFPLKPPRRKSQHSPSEYQSLEGKNSSAISEESASSPWAPPGRWRAGWPWVTVGTELSQDVSPRPATALTKRTCVLL